MNQSIHEGKRRVYSRPELTEHGDVELVTRAVKQGTGARDNDPNASYKTK